MGARYRDLKAENASVRKALEGFVSKVNLKPGDMVVFSVDQRSIGNSFGYGWGGMDNLSKMMSELAGGPVRIIATSDKNPFDVSQLDKFGRAKLRALLDQLDSLAAEKDRENTIPRAIATPR